MQPAPQQLERASTRPERELDRILHSLRSGAWSIRAADRDGAWQRAELAVPDTDPLTFLRRVAAAAPGGVHYWSDRRHTLQSAGVGTAAELTGDAGVDFADVCGRAQELIGCRRQRLYGGFRFATASNDAAEPLWRPFGSYRFTLPRVELTRTTNGTVLACNFRRAEIATLHDHIQPLAVACRRALAVEPGAVAPEAARLNPVHPYRHEPDRTRWQRIVAAVLQRLAGGLNGGGRPLEKIVLARRTTFAFPAPVDALALLERLRGVNPTAFHFAMQPVPGLAFFGASPERLLRISGSTLETEALAGTRPRGATRDADERLEAELIRSDKEVREHGLVHTRIAECLRELCSEVTTQDAVRVRKLAHVQHLHTSFRGTLRPGLGLADALHWLHPTPAVGGYPTCGVSDLIAATEGFDRGWYAGPVGWIGADEAEFAVAIRSGVAAGEHLHLYAGNGIVRGSNAAAEWAEMEQKILQILDVV
jgi:menaquinone-specific isochorismate synthase